MNLQPHFIEATTIDDAHFKLIRKIFQAGRIYIIDRGSYEGHKRLEYDFVTFHIKYPGTRPLAPQMPPGVPPVTDDKTIEEYFVKYLWSDDIAKEEEYTYGQFIRPQLEPVIKMLRDQGAGTNQATIAIGNENSINQEYPPCLRLIDCRVMHEKLHFIVYFRCIEENTKMWCSIEEETPKICSLKNVYDAFRRGKTVHVLGADSKFNSKWSKIIGAERRKANDIKHVHLLDGTTLKMTDDHWVYVEENNIIKLIQVKNLNVKHKLLKLSNGYAILNETKPITEIDLAPILLNFSSYYYIRNLDLSVYKSLRRKEIDIKSSWVDKKILPLILYNLLNVDWETVTVGAKGSHIKLKRFFKLTPELGYLFGFFLGDGWFTSNSIRLAVGNKKTVINKVKNILSKLNLGYSEYMQGNCLILSIANKTFSDVMKALGFVHYAKKKHVPNFIYKTTIDFKEQVLEGWFDSDAFVTISEKLIKDMRFLAISVGQLTSKYYEKERTVMLDGRSVTASPCWKMGFVTGERRFNKNDFISYPIKSIDRLVTSGYVIDIEVHKINNFIISDGNFLVHNSWDLMYGTPENLGGLQRLKEYMASEIGIEDGEMICSSKGLHLYDYQWPVAKARLNNLLPEDCVVSEKEVDAGEGWMSNGKTE